MNLKKLEIIKVFTIGTFIYDLIGNHQRFSPNFKTDNELEVSFYIEKTNSN
jgi:hypothetical protein